MDTDRGETMARTKDGGDALRQFKSDLRAGTLRTLYVFCGEEAYLREYYIRQLEQKLTGGSPDAFNYHRFSAENFSPEAVSDAVEAMPMLSDRTLVRIDDIDLFKLAEGARGQMTDILCDLPDYCCVALYYDTVPYKPNGTMKKLAGALKEHAQVLEFSRPGESDLAAWVLRHFRAHEKAISDELCRYLIFLTDGSMTTLGSEIDKIAAFCSGQAVTRSDIDAVVTPALSAQSFDISNAVAKGNYELALTKLQTLFALQEDEFMILGALGAQLRRLYYARVVAAAGKGADALMELTGMKSYAAGVTMTAARGMTDRFCERAVELCMETDYQMKSSGGDAQRLLELLLARLYEEARRA